MIFLPKCKPESNHEGTPDKLKWRDILQSNWPVIFRSAAGQARESQGKSKEPFYPQGDQGDLRILCSFDSEGVGNPSVIKDIIWDIWQNFSEAWELDGRNLSVLISWFWCLSCGYVGYILVCRKCPLTFSGMKRHQVNNSQMVQEAEKLFVLCLPLFWNLWLFKINSLRAWVLIWESVKETQVQWPIIGAWSWG